MELDQNLLSMRVNGFCVLENVVPEDQCAKIRESVTAVVQQERQNYNNAPKAIGFVPSIINHDQSFASYLADKRLMEVVEGMLGKFSRISFTSAIINEQGNERGEWHADWPFNQHNAGHFPAPYADNVAHLTTLWMISPFRKENGGTLVVPGSHRYPTNPTAGNVCDPCASFPGEINVSGSKGSILVFDSRLWHASSPNRQNEPRVALAVRYAPWWLNTEVLRPGSKERRRMVDEPGQKENQVPSLSKDVFQKLPADVQPLYQHWVAG